MNAPTVAALFVETDGVYYGLDGVDPWDAGRDARLYDGPFPVVAHPPCARWSLMGVCRGYYDGQDDGCFEAALYAVRRFGGVLEHPAHTLAWKTFGLTRPASDGWTRSLLDQGWTCQVDQRLYGHQSRKPTWLYCSGIDDPPVLRWGVGPRGATTVGRGFGGGREHLRARTPVAFRDELLAIARSAANPCPECHGEGRVTVAGYSVSPYSGVAVCDPQEAHDELCDACGGSGDARASSAQFAEARNPTRKPHSGAG